MKIQIARIGPPAHAGSIVAPGAIPAASVPLCEDFDPMLRPIGRVDMHADGTGEIELLGGVEIDTSRLEADHTIGMAFRVLEQHEQDGVRVIDRLELFAVGVSRDLILKGRSCA